MLIADYFRKRGLSRRVEVHLFTPEPQPMLVAGPQLGEAVGGMLHAKGIQFHPLHKLTSVEPNARDLIFENGERVRYDLLVAVPPHRAPKVVKEAGLTNQAGWIPVDTQTLATIQPGVYAIRDVTAISLPGRWKPDVPLMLPKAGVFAHAQGEVVARRIAAEIRGRSCERSSAAMVIACWRPAKTSLALHSGTSLPSQRRMYSYARSERPGTSGRCSLKSGGSHRLA